MQPKDLLHRYQQGERNFAHTDLNGAILSGANLQDIDLSGANLTGVNLSWAFLSRANLTGATLRQADLRSTALNSANFTDAVLAGANLTKADMRLATLQGANLNWAILQEVDLSLANLQNARLDQADLQRAKLNNAKLMRAELMEANLQGANLTGADLSHANLREAHLDNAMLRGALLISTNLTEVNLTSAYLRQANLTRADLHRVNLQGADLSEAILDYADLSRANLSGSYLLKARCHKTYLPRADLQDAYLLQTDLTEANFRGALLCRADLSGAYLQDTILSEADLTQALLLQCHLIRANLDGAQLTGCCIYNWQVEASDLSKVNCHYVFKQFNHTDKQPIGRYPSGRNFEPGELAERHGNNQTIQLTVADRPYWQALLFALAQVEHESIDLKLTIIAYEVLNGNGVVHLAANRPVNATLITQRILMLYPTMQDRWMQRQEVILTEMGILARDDTPEPPTAKSPAVRKIPTSRKERLYQQLVQYIQPILFAQTDQDRAEYSAVLLDFLTNQRIGTQEAQRQLISKVIVKHAGNDKAFLDHLLRWEQSLNKATPRTPIEEALRSAIAHLWS